MSKVILIDWAQHFEPEPIRYSVAVECRGAAYQCSLRLLNIMFKILDEEKADYLAVAFVSVRRTFRREMFEAYKGTRKPMPEELREQVPMIKEVLHAMLIPTLEHAGYEADDILGTLGKAYEAAGI